MSSKKKVQKKKGKAKDVSDDFDDLVENANDDGCGLSRKYATDIIRFVEFQGVLVCSCLHYGPFPFRLIKCHSKPLNKVAAEFVEVNIYFISHFYLRIRFAPHSS